MGSFRHSLVGACLLVLLVTACSKSPSSPSTPNPGTPSPGSAISYTAVGASDATGIGASVPCGVLQPCPNGTGYVPDIVRQLQARGSTVTLMNLGIPGAVIGPDIQAIAISAGRSDLTRNFIEHEMPFVSRDSTVVTIFAGGNDANAIADAISRGAGGSDPNGYADTQVRAFASDYQTLLSGIRSRAPNALVVVANLPNLAGLPYSAGYPVAAKQLLQRLAVGFTTQAVNTLAGQSIPVVDLMCDSRSYDAGNYSPDGFHPNDAGYSYIADQFVKAITTSDYATPQVSCAPMTLVR